MCNQIKIQLNQIYLKSQTLGILQQMPKFHLRIEDFLHNKKFFQTPFIRRKRQMKTLKLNITMIMMSNKLILPIKRKHEGFRMKVKNIIMYIIMKKNKINMGNYRKNNKRELQKVQITLVLNIIVLNLILINHIKLKKSKKKNNRRKINFLKV